MLKLSSILFGAAKRRRYSSERVGGVFRFGLEMGKFAVLHFGPVLETVLVELHDNLIRPCSLDR